MVKRTRRREPRGVSGTLIVSPTGSIPRRNDPAWQVTNDKVEASRAMLIAGQKAPACQRPPTRVAVWQRKHEKVEGARSSRPKFTGREGAAEGGSPCSLALSGNFLEGLPCPNRRARSRRRKGASRQSAGLYVGGFRVPVATLRHHESGASDHRCAMPQTGDRGIAGQGSVRHDTRRRGRKGSATFPSTEYTSVFLLWSAGLAGNRT